MLFETDLANAAWWFLTGVILYDFIAKMIGYSKALHLISTANYIILRTLGNLEQDIAFFKQMKHLSLREAGVSVEKIKVVEKTDEENLETWKKTTIKNIIAAHPQRYRSFVQYKDWNEAMGLLTKIIKKDS